MIQEVCQTAYNVIDLIGIDLFIFYLFETPYAKSDKSAASSSLGINLSTYGWEGQKNRLLMQQISRFFQSDYEIDNFKFYASSLSEEVKNRFYSISKGRMSNMGFFVINGKYTLKSKQDYTSAKYRPSEAYVTCFFRHIRNAFAHGNIAMRDGFVELTDSTAKPMTDSSLKNYSSLVRVHPSTLREIQETVLSGPREKDFYTDKMDRDYRVDVRSSFYLDKED